jgi:hypothetical protein
MAVAVGDHVGAAWAVADQAHLAHEVAFLQGHLEVRQLHRHLARGDEVHGIGRTADPDDLFARQRHHGA